MTSSVSRFAGPTRFFGDAYRGRVSVRAFVVGDCALMLRLW